MLAERIRSWPAETKLTKPLGTRGNPFVDHNMMDISRLPTLGSTRVGSCAVLIAAGYRSTSGAGSS